MNTESPVHAVYDNLYSSFSVTQEESDNKHSSTNTTSNSNSYENKRVCSISTESTVTAADDCGPAKRAKTFERSGSEQATKISGSNNNNLCNDDINGTQSTVKIISKGADVEHVKLNNDNNNNNNNNNNDNMCPTDAEEGQVNNDDPSLARDVEMQDDMAASFRSMSHDDANEDGENAEGLLRVNSRCGSTGTSAAGSPHGMSVHHDTEAGGRASALGRSKRKQYQPRQTLVLSADGDGPQANGFNGSVCQIDDDMNEGSMVVELENNAPPVIEAELQQVHSQIMGMQQKYFHLLAEKQKLLSGLIPISGSPTDGVPKVKESNEDAGADGAGMEQDVLGSSTETVPVETDTVVSSAIFEPDLTGNERSAAILQEFGRVLKSQLVQNVGGTVDMIIGEYFNQLAARHARQLQQKQVLQQQQQLEYDQQTQNAAKKERAQQSSQRRGSDESPQRSQTDLNCDLNHQTEYGTAASQNERILKEQQPQQQQMSPTASSCSPKNETSRNQTPLGGIEVSPIPTSSWPLRPPVHAFYASPALYASALQSFANATPSATFPNLIPALNFGARGAQSLGSQGSAAVAANLLGSAFSPLLPSNELPPVTNVASSGSEMSTPTEQRPQNQQHHPQKDYAASRKRLHADCNKALKAHRFTSNFNNNNNDTIDFNTSTEEGNNLVTNHLHYEAALSLVMPKKRRSKVTDSRIGAKMSPAVSGTGHHTPSPLGHLWNLANTVTIPTKVEHSSGPDKGASGFKSSSWLTDTHESLPKLEAPMLDSANVALYSHPASMVPASLDPHIHSPRDYSQAQMQQFQRQMLIAGSPWLSAMHRGMSRTSFGSNNSPVRDSASAGDGPGKEPAFGQNTTLSPMHLRKAKLMFLFTRYPSSGIIKAYFPDIHFTKNNTAQLVKWFSNFREFYYIQMEKYARQALDQGILHPQDITVSTESELYRVLNLHYNRNNNIVPPPTFRAVVEITLREFFSSIQANRDAEPSWKKVIYKVIARHDDIIPDYFKMPNFLEQLES